MRKQFYLILIFLISCKLYSQKIPEWISNPTKKYPSMIYEVGVGSGASQKEADSSSFIVLSSAFGISVKQDTKAQKKFIETSKGVEKNNSLEDNSLIESEHDLINVRIVERHYDSKLKKYYSLAVMNKRETIPLIEKAVHDNVTNIKSYIDKSKIEQDNFKKISVLEKAYMLAMKNDSFLQQISVLDNGNNLKIEDNVKSHSIKSMIDNIYKNTTFHINTTEISPSIKLAIEQMISDLKLNISSNNPTYIFKENITYDGKDSGYGIYVINYTLLLELLNSKGERMASFTFKGKEIGENENDAKKVLMTKLGKSIREPLKNQFEEFLSGILQ